MTGASTSQTSASIEGLTNGTTYKFSLKYVNSDGEGDMSNQISFKPFAPASVPTNFIGSGYWSGVGAKKVSLSFEQPADNGGNPIIRYEVSLNGVLKSQPVSPSPIDITIGAIDWVAGNTVVATVKAISQSADGEISGDEATLNVTLFKNPEPPTSIQAVGSDGAVTLSWNEPTDFGGLELSGYVVKKANGTFVGTTSSTSLLFTVANGDRTQYKVYTVTTIPETDYEINKELYSSSSELSPSADATVPHLAPEITNVIMSGLTMTLTITDNGLPATKATAFVVDSVGSSAIYQGVLTNNAMTFTGITNITSYMVFVANSLGETSNLKFQISTTAP